MTLVGFFNMAQLHFLTVILPSDMALEVCLGQLRGKVSATINKDFEIWMNRQQGLTR